MTQKDNDTLMHVTIAADQSGERLDRVLAAALADLSRSLLKALLTDAVELEGGLGLNATHAP